MSQLPLFPRPLDENFTVGIGGGVGLPGHGHSAVAPSSQQQQQQQQHPQRRRRFLPDIVSEGGSSGAAGPAAAVAPLHTPLLPFEGPYADPLLGFIFLILLLQDMFTPL